MARRSDYATELDWAIATYRERKKWEGWFQTCKAALKNNKPQYMQEFRAFCNEQAQSGNKEFREYYKRSYMVTALTSFDEYMIAVEWNRPLEKKFWLPRRKILLPVANAMQELVDGELDLLAVSLPPGTGKTTLKNFLLTWVAGRFPDMPNLDSGHSSSMTRSTYDGCLQIMRDPEYCWGQIFVGSKIITDANELRIDVDKKHRFSTITCRSIDGSLTGATRAEMLLTADDLVSGIEEAMSKERLDKKWFSYTNDLKSRKKETARELHIATRWSVHDVIGRLEDQYGESDRAKFIVIPALDANDESNFEYYGTVGFNTQYFMDMKNNLDDVSFKCLYQNQPIEREGLLYPEDGMRRYYELPDGDPDAILAVCDPAEGGGDDLVLLVFAVYGNDHYLVDCVCSDALPDVTDPLVANALFENNVQMAQFESNAAGGRIADKAQDNVKSLGGKTKITKRRNDGNKLTRMIVNSAWIKEHCLLKDRKVIEKKSDYSKVINKLCTFPMTGKAKHDDVPDAFAQYAVFYDNMVGNVAQVVHRPF